MFKNSYSCFKLDKLLEKKYSVDNADYLGSSKENHTIKKKYIKIKSFLFSKYTCFLLLGMLQFNTWMWEMSWEYEFKNNTIIEDTCR